jgi:phosphohistidine phosphatase SixA
MNHAQRLTHLAVGLFLFAAPLPAQLDSPASDNRAAAAPLVILVRHAETDSGGGSDPGLSHAGQTRAAALAIALSDARITRVVSSSLQRTRETAGPTAEHFALSTIAVSVSGEGGLAGHVERVLAAISAPATHGAVLVVGHSNTVPRIIEALGGPALTDLEHADYGGLFVLQRHANGEASLIRSDYGAQATQATEPDAPAAYNVRDPVPSATFPEQASSQYVLPYPVGDRHNVRQGNGNPYNTHNDKYGATFAYDFEMPIGSELVAARGGVVFKVEERFTDSQRGVSQGNYVAIDHGDNTYAVYGHITHEGALVEVGETVEQGQLIASSGNSGLSRGPHLHFAVKQCPPEGPLGGPDCTTIPVSFRNTRPHPRGLIGSPTSELGGGESYEALDT